ncbi:unnamed protein product [Rotaria sp. Silwood1]|nr:unnamed protein product [Rotaria sp. Silwood1]CAF3646941.1 unnamed protein product [Rotaria sp. Silwood1]CAF3677793.1 unnamed protein product [Rotaria sp. Silwood1]CAF4758044.1 unnamed protein product [Rotaria sp. Silwood1]
MRLLLLIITLGIDVGFGQFSALTSDYDAYGLKITGNDIMLIEALDDTQVFVIRFAPYNYTSQPLQCSVTYNDSTHYVYSIGIGEKQMSNQLYFFYAGEILPNNPSVTNLLGYSSTFIGILINKDPQNAQIYENNQTLFNCNNFEYQSLQFISSYGHQEFFVFGVEPYGQYAIGLAQDFVFIYRPFSDNMIRIKNSSLVWPANTIFMPMAADTDISYTIVAGFVINGPLFRVRATPTVYVISNSDLTVLATWSYTAALNSWQSHLTYSNFKTWSNKYVMSVNINLDDPSRILVGMPFLNIVFLLNVSLNGSNITLDSFVDNEDSKGFGKSVTWLSNSDAAILSSNYPRDDSSKIYLYRSLNNRSLPSLPSAIFPNLQQTLPKTINVHFIRMISTPTSLAILGIASEILLILSAPPGYFASTSLSITDSILTVSQSMICMAGTYKMDSSIFPCSLCPSGSQNSGKLPASSCMICSSDSFCPMGAVADINTSFLLPQLQSQVYPRSPEVTAFDEILLQNMFSTSSHEHCIFISPLFWVLFVIGIVFIILLGMGILKRYVRHPRGYEVRQHVKKIFRKIDLIDEGEMWVGGMVSLAIMVLLLFSYTFSAAFYLQYPSNNSAPSTFACDEIIRNVKYESGLQSLSITVSKEEQPMFDLLNKQHFILRLDLLNTIASCKSLSVQQILGSTTSKVISTCTDSIGILTAAIELAYQKAIIKWILNDIALIGAVRISLSADEQENESYRLKKLDFSQTFYDDSNRTLAQTATINLKLTKAINETEPLRGHESSFSGIWYPTFAMSEEHVFISSDEYGTSANLTSTTLTIVISETSYYIKNRQLPIAKLREIIFHNLLFTVVCLEIFRLLILLWKLTMNPLLNFIMRHLKKTNEIVSTKTESVDHVTIIDDHDTTTDDHDTTIHDHSTTTNDHTTTTNDHSTTTNDHSTTTNDHGTTTKDYNIVEFNS